MLQNAYLLAKIGADTAENEQHFAEILPIGRRVAAPPGAAASLTEAAERFKTLVHHSPLHVAGGSESGRQAWSGRAELRRISKCCKILQI